MKSLSKMTERELADEKNQTIYQIKTTGSWFAKRDLRKHLDKITREMSKRARNRQNKTL